MENLMTTSQDLLAAYGLKIIAALDMVFGVGYGDDLRKVKDVLMDILAKDKRVLEDPAPTVAVLDWATTASISPCGPGLTRSRIGTSISRPCKP